jgi:hypothetical protein
VKKLNDWVKRTLKETVNNSEDRKLSDDSSQRYANDIPPEKISRPISSENEEDNCSEAENDGTWTKQEQRGLILVKENEEFEKLKKASFISGINEGEGKIVNKS